MVGRGGCVSRGSGFCRVGGKGVVVVVFCWFGGVRVIVRWGFC